MKINLSQYTVDELAGMLERRDLVVNDSYQRSSGIWPPSARSYFIDTILEGFPVPKIYLYQAMENRRPVREVVDGQQRVTTIMAFLRGEFALSNVSRHYAGMRFADLDEDKQNEFRFYTLQADVILGAQRSELFEMFRRMNAYTAPLNGAEKRHAQFQGAFKWYVVDLADNFSPALEGYNVYTERQILRMADAEFLAEITAVLLNGIQAKSEALFKSLYTTFDGDFPRELECRARVGEFFALLANEFAPLQRTFIMKPYALYSLFAATMQARYGIPNGDDLGIQPNRSFYRDLNAAINGLTRLASAHELQEVNGPYGEYVRACLQTTTKQAQRTTRAREMARVLV